jgi:hypothetical protein
MALTSLYCCLLNLTGRDKGGYYHELFLRSKRFLSHRIQRMKIKGTGARKPGSPETEPNFYNTAFLPSTSVPTSNNTLVSSMVSNMLASGPNMYPGTGGAMPLQQVLAFPTFGASLPHHQAQFAPPPLFRSSASLLVEAQHAQARLQQLRMSQFYPGTHMTAGFGQHHIPMVAVPQNFSNAAAMAMALSHIEQDQAALLRSRSLFMGAHE